MASYLDAQLHSRLACVCKGIEGQELFDALVALVNNSRIIGAPAGASAEISQYF